MRWRGTEAAARGCAAMPRYRFHLRNDQIVDDEEGLYLADPGEARRHAIEAAREIACEHIKRYGNVNLDHFIEVADEAGEPIFRVAFRDAFTVIGEP
jgi:hypothetical protein